MGQKNIWTKKKPSTMKKKWKTDWEKEIDIGGKQPKIEKQQIIN